MSCVLSTCTSMQISAAIEALARPATVLVPASADLFVLLADGADDCALLFRLLHLCARSSADLGNSAQEALACCARSGQIVTCAKLSLPYGMTLRSFCLSSRKCAGPIVSPSNAYATRSKGFRRYGASRVTQAF